MSQPLEQALEALKTEMSLAPFDTEKSLSLIRQIASESQQQSLDLNRAGWLYVGRHQSISRHIIFNLRDSLRVKGSALEIPDVMTETQAVKLLQCLWGLGVKVNDSQNSYEHCIDRLAIDYGLEEVFRACIDQDQEKKIPSHSIEISLLGWAILSNKTLRVQELIDAGYPFHYADQHGLTPLELATRMGNDEIVKILTKHPETIAYPKSDLQSLYLKEEALAVAIKQGSVSMVDFLVKIGVHLNEECAEDQFCDPEFPIHWALRYKNEEVLKCLIAHGADVNKVNKNGDTPCHTAVLVPFKEALKILIAAGADWQRKNNQQRTPFQEARRFKYRGEGANELRQLSLIDKERKALVMATNKVMKKKENPARARDKVSKNDESAESLAVKGRAPKRKNRI